MSGVGLSVRNLIVERDGRIVLRIPSFEVAAGAAVALHGPNGAGKSTLLGALAGLEASARGDVSIGGVPARGLAARRRVALLPQDAPMLAGTVLENVALPLRLRGAGARERTLRAAERLERHGLAALGPRRASSLSGGEARRVALARALVAGPEALLLDEPFSGVDAPSREALVDDVRAQVREAGITLVVVTQHRDEALRMASRLAVILDGEVAQEGAPEEVFARPASAAVARFVEVGNVVRGRVAGGGILEIGAVRVQTGDVLPSGSAAWLVLSPDHVEIRPASNPPGGSARNVLPARVVGLDPREGRVQVRLDAGFPLVAAVTRAAVDELGLAPGVPVLAVFKAMACHLVAAGPEAR